MISLLKIDMASSDSLKTDLEPWNPQFSSVPWCTTVPLQKRVDSEAGHLKHLKKLIVTPWLVSFTARLSEPSNMPVVITSIVIIISQCMKVRKVTIN